VCAEAAFPLSSFRRGDVMGDQWGALQQAAQRVQDFATWVDDTPAPTLAHIRGSIETVKRELETDPLYEGKTPLRLVVVDYLQLLKPAPVKDQNREQQVAALTRELKEIARAEKIAIVVLSQLNRGVEQRQNKRPTMADLRESGAIEQDADSVVFVYRDEYYDKNSRAKGRAELLVEKQRNGPQGRAIAAFDGAYTLFRELTDGERRQLESEREDEPAREAPQRRSKW
jgi:replicative DNA helicase